LLQPAVAVQGHASPRMQFNLVMHNGNGGMWLDEHARGTFSHNFIETREGAWRVGGDVMSEIEGDNLSAQEMMWQHQDLMSGEKLIDETPEKVVIVLNPDNSADDRLSLGMGAPKQPMVMNPNVGSGAHEMR